MHNLYDKEQRIGATLQQLLIKHDISDWAPDSSSQLHLPNLMARHGSYQFNPHPDETTGPGMMLYADNFAESSPKIREGTMCLPAEATTTLVISDSLRNQALGGALDYNIAACLCSALHRYAFNNVSVMHAQEDDASLIDDWIVESGAPSHITACRRDFVTYKPIPPLLIKGIMQ